MKPQITGGGTSAGAALAFVAGFVDAAAFIALTGLFTAHVTGNFVLIGAELVASSTGVLAKVLALPVFMGAVAWARILALLLERQGADPLPWLLALEAALLAGFGLCGTLWSPLDAPDGAPALVVGMLAVAAMGVQNAIGRLSLGHLAPTTVMTVSVSQAVIDAMDLVLKTSGNAAPTRARLLRVLPAIATFAAGALCGAFGVAHLAFGCIVLPIMVLIGLIAFVAMAPAEANAAT
ncbi:MULTISPECIES: YoaK family protein [unclassified Methylobacterium]|uniref:YoaK family protein n=1 Tax=unclassified Methylobacterium TaxID=2615210 RepID=UPI003702BB6E